MAISDHDRKMLWGQSGFQCAICKVRLAEDATGLDKASLIGEECHIVAQSPDGPRGEHRDGVVIDSYDNHILLCRNHHKMIDDQTHRFTVETLRLAKQAHEALVREALPAGVVEDNQDEPTETVYDPAKPVKDLRKEPFSGSSVILDTFPAEAFLHSQYDDQSFGWRLSDAFPGRRRGLTVIDDPRAALDRLDVVLRHPIETLHHNEDGSTNAYHPFYWYRGFSNMSVDRYARLDDERCLIGERQFLISRIAAYRDTSDPRQFLYIETRAEPPVGVYEYADGQIENAMQHYGYYYDEAYALWNGRVITAGDYEDRATVIDAKPVAVRGAEFRIRFLTPYNMNLATRHHVINDGKYDDVLGNLLDGILKRERSLEEVCALIRELPLPPRMDPWY